MKLIITFLSFFIIVNANAQLNKDIWLVGGTGSFLSSSTEYTSPTYSSTSKRVDISISPAVGYFIIDKLLVGIKTSYTKYKERQTNPSGFYSNINRFKVGPFGRYYLLEKDKPYNVLADISYQYGLYSFKPTKGNSNTFSASIGPVVYFNTSVGLEFLLGYYSTKETIKQSGDNINKQSGFQIGIGFQIHLEKEY